MIDPEKPSFDGSQFSRPRLWVRITLSVFLIYQLVVMAVLANGSSFLGRSLDRWIGRYGSLLGLNVTWNFFAPDPAHTMFIRYRVRFENPQDESETSQNEEARETIEGFIPPEREKIVIDTSKRRFLYAVRFLIFDEKRMKGLLAPFLCRQHPGAHAIHLENILEPIPNLDLSQIGHLQKQEERTFMESTYLCNQAQDEVSL